MKTKPEIGHKRTPALLVAGSGFNGTSAQGIVTRMGHDLGHGGEAIEPGPVGMRPEVLNLFAFASALRLLARPEIQALVSLPHVHALAARPDIQALINKCERAGRATGGACDARGEAFTVPLGNTGTTVVKGAQ